MRPGIGREHGMNRVRSQRIILLILVLVVLAETAWILRQRGAGGPAERWDFAIDTELSEDFGKALADGRIEVWFQPIVNPGSKETVGAEALSRWRDGDGFFSPSVFIPALEETGQIRDLDRHVFKTVCAFQKERSEAGAELFPVSVNLSVVSSMQEGIVSEYEEILRASGLPAGCVNIEVTESLDADREVLSQVVHDFHAAGFLVEIDDFGAGYASYANLAVIPYDILKIDKSLIDEIGSDRGDRLIRDLIRLAKDFGLRTIAEGVETAAQAEYLHSVGCDAIQGYYYSRPLPPHDFADYLAP